MLQEFFTTSLQSTLIKNIVETIPIPNVRTVRDGDIIVEGLTYIYKSYPIKCTKTGVLKGGKLTLSDLSLGSKLKSDIAEYEEADVEIKDYNFKAGRHKMNLTKKHVCKNGYYDQQTHRLLGDYLRCVRDVYNINLMHLYNCFNYQLTDDLYFLPNDEIQEGTVVYDESDQYKVILIPIKFNKEYTIAVDCTQDMYIKPTLYSHFGVMSDIEEQYTEDVDVQKQDSETGEYYTTKQTVKQFRLQNKAHSQFQKPFVFSIFTRERSLLQYEKFLYLVMQLPKTNTSSIAVLEGDYSKYETRQVMSFDQALPHELDSALTSKPNLLLVNDGHFYAYNDILIEYLLNNVIHHDESIPKNIKRVQVQLNKKLNDLQVSTNRREDDMWYDNMRQALYHEMISNIPQQNLVPLKNDVGRIVAYEFTEEYKPQIMDCNGFVDKAMEQLLYRGE